jgi:CubicO group peptidase (beta-lactamase class C family)
MNLHKLSIPVRLRLSLPLVSIMTCISCNSGQADLQREINTIENGLLTAILVRGDTATSFNILERMDFHKVPGVSMAVVEKGKIRWAKGYGTANTRGGQEVVTGTLFQAGSISKPLAALAALKLVEEGKLGLDENVNHYLKGWKIPENEFTKVEKVTLRRLLTHTAGMTVHGFPGYRSTDSLPTIEAVLEGKGNTPAVLVDTIPGSIWRYSGGGYTVMEKVVEDVSGLPFEVYMAENMLSPMGMDHSTYAQPLPVSLHAMASAAYDTEGELIEGLWHHYPEQAAAGLWTTPTDLARYCIEIQEILSGKKEGILKQESVRMMLTKHMNDWGLGPSLAWDADSLRFQHGGKNAGFTNQMTAFAHRGSAVIIMTNADNGGKLIGEIMRSVSDYYDWGISLPRMVDTVALPVERLSLLAGRYKLDFQVPEIGDYLIGVDLMNGRLYVADPNDNDTIGLTALNDSVFMNLEKGDEVKFQVEDDPARVGLLWNQRFQFYKIPE